MNERRKAEIIDRCLSAVQSGEWSKEECFQRYPKLAGELRSIFQAAELLSSNPSVEMGTNQLRIAKMQLLNRLPDRDQVVTKPGLNRYKWQTTKRRFVMTWVIIVTTILSLMTGTGAVFASGDALPGDALYPVKTMMEQVQLAFASDEADAGLYLKFLETRVQEMETLMEQGRFDDLDEIAAGYQNQTQAMAQLMAEIQAENPDEAVKLRTELEQKLQEHASLIEAILDEDSNANGDQVRDQLQEMLQTNTQTRLRIHEEVEDELPPEDGEETSGDEPSATEGSDETVDDMNGNGVQVRNSAFVNAGGDAQNATFTFRITNAEQLGVYAELAGSYYSCTADGDLVNCDVPNAVSKGTLKLYCLTDNSLLYSYDYDYDWLGEKESGSSGNQMQGDGGGDGGDHENGHGGKGK